MRRPIEGPAIRIIVTPVGNYLACRRGRATLWLGARDGGDREKVRLITINGPWVAWMARYDRPLMLGRSRNGRRKG